jgi:hypothetical protein
MATANELPLLVQIGQVASIPVTVLLYYLASRRDQRKNLAALNQTFYSRLDQNYFELLKLVLERPFLADPERAGSEDERVQYHAYAFMVWNFIETIHDYCLGDERLEATWICIMQSEARTHGEWFNRPENRSRFKQPFQDYIERNGYTRGGQAA